MKKILFFATVAVLVLSGCGPTGPTEDEVRTKLVGTYCSADKAHRLEIKADGRYENRRLRRNPFGGTSLSETCEGNFKLVQDDQSNWTLVFEKSDKKSNPMAKSCTGEMLVWDVTKEAYTIETDGVTLNEPFDQTPVVLGACQKEEL